MIQKKNLALLQILMILASFFPWNFFNLNPVPIVRAAATAECRVEGSAIPSTKDVQLGESFSFTAEISNSGADPGFSPMIEFILPSQVTFNSATFTVGDLPLSVTGSPVVITDNDGGNTNLGTITNPITNETSGPDEPTAIVGSTYYAFELPLGSFVPGQTSAGIKVNATLTNGLPPGVTLSNSISSRCGFALGSDPQNNPATDAPVKSTFIDLPVRPTVFTVGKSATTSAGEEETSTGENFPITYTISADIAANELVSGIVLTENLPTNLQLIKVNSVDDNSNGFTITFTPFGQASQNSINAPFTPIGPFPPGGTLAIAYSGTITGTTDDSDVSIEFEAFVPEKDQANADVLSATTGAKINIDNTASGTGNHSSGVVNSTSDTVTIKAGSSTLQKGVSIANDVAPVDYSPGDQVQFTVDFQVSDFFTHDQFVIEDVMGDGLVYDSGSARLSMTEDGMTTTGITFNEQVIVNDANAVTGPAPYAFAGGECAGCELAITKDTIDNNDANTPPADGQTHFAFDVSAALAGEPGLDGVLVGGQVGPTPVGQPTSGVITYTATIQDDYIDSQTFDSSIDAFDEINNSVTSSGRIPSSGNYVTDTSSAQFSIVKPTFSKGTKALNDTVSGVDAAPFAANPIEISPGDSVIYSLTTTIPTGDLEDLIIEDFLPIPFFDVDDANADSVADTFTFDANTLTTQYNPVDGNSTTASIPAVGTIGYGNNTSGPASFMSALPTPVITQSPSSNKLTINFPDNVSFDVDPSASITIELLFTITATDAPFASGLRLVNLSTFTGGDSNNSSATTASQGTAVTTSMPAISVYKGVVDTDKAGATFSPTQKGPAGVAFNSASSPVFSPVFGSTALQANPISSDLSDVDAGDKVTFVMAFENTGSSEAHNLIITDTVGSGFVVPASPAALNLQVYLADGTNIGASTTGGLFGQSVINGLTDGTDTSIAVTGPLAKHDASNGSNIVVVSYDLVVAQGAEANQTLKNLGSLTQFAANPGGANFVQQTSLYQQEAEVITSSISMTKANLDSTVNNNADTGTTQGNGSRRDITIGESTKYRLTITVPEGTTPSVSLSDNLPGGIGYDTDVGFAVVNDCTGTTFNGTIPAFTVNSPSGPGIAGSGNNISLSFNAPIITTNDNNINNNTFCLEYDAVMLDNGSANGLNASNKRNRATLTYGSGPTTTPNADSRVDVVEPQLQVAKTINTATGEAGDVREYRFVVDHTADSSANAYDITITDTLPAGITAVGDFDTDGLDNDGDGLIDGADPDELNGNAAPFYNSATDAFTWNNTSTNNTEFNNLPLGQSIDFRFKVVIDNTVNPTQVISNTGNVSYDSMPGTPVKGIQRSGAGNNSVNLSILNISTGKGVNTTSEISTGTSQHNAAIDDLTIGETVTYRITLDVPESTIDNLIITDTLPNFLGVVSANIFQDDTGSAANPIQITDTQNGDGINDTVTVTFPTISNLPDADTEQIIIDIVAQVVLNAGNVNSATPLTNTVTANWDNAAAPLSSTVDVELVEPDLDIDKTINTSTGDAGDIREYRLVVDHNANSTANAFDVVITDTLPAGITAVGDFDTDGLDNDGDGLIDGADPDELNGNAAPFYNSATDAFTWNNANTNNVKFDQLPLGQSIDFRFRVSIDNSVFPNQVINNNAALNWDTLPADGDPQERSYSDSDNVNLTINNLSPSKVVSSSHPTGAFNAALPDLGIGSEVRYRISVPIPESTFTNFTITDKLPEIVPGVKFRVDSGSLIQDDGVSHTKSPDISIQDNVGGADGINDTIVFDFGNITNTPDADTETIIVEVVATVIDNPANVAGTGYTNTAEINYAERVGGPLTATADVDIAEPSLNITKSVSPITGDSGDPFEYTITVNNTGTGTAYDLNITDQVPPEFTVDGNFNADGVDNTGSGADDEVGPYQFFTGGTRLFTWNATTTGLSGASPSFAQLAPGATLTFKYKGHLNSTVNPNDTITNAINISYDTFPGSNTDQRIKTGATNVDINVPLGGGLVKTIRDGITNKKIGDLIPYRVVVTIPEGTINPLIITDTLPAGLAFVPGTTSITNLNGAISLTVPSPTPSETPASAAIVAGQSQTIAWNFGSVTNSDTNNANSETFAIEYDAVVMNTNDNNNNNTKVNSVSADFGGAGTVGPAAGPTVTIQEPNMSIVKTTSPVYTSGDTVTYQIRLENNGAASAYDVSVNDLIPTGATYAGGLNVVNGPAFTVNTTGAPNIIFSTSEVAPTFNTANPIIFTFNTTLDSATASGTNLNNTATLTYTSQSGSITDRITGNALSNERTGVVTDPGGTANDLTDNSAVAITVTRPDLNTSAKAVVDVNGGDLVPGDVLRYTITINNTGNQNATGISMVDDLPANVNNFTLISKPLGSNDSVTPAPAGANNNGQLSVNTISVNAGNSETIVYEVTLNSALPAGTAINNSVVINPSSEGGRGGSGSTSSTSQAPDIAFTKNVDKATSLTGEELTYTITATNNGNGDASNVTIIDTLPGDVTYNVNSTTIDTVAKTDIADADEVDFNITNAGKLTVHLGNLAKTITKTIQFKVTVDPSALGKLLTNSADITDAQGTNKNATADTQVQNPEFTLTKIASNTNPSIGNTFNYTITIQNTSPAPATNVVITDILPPNLNLIGAPSVDGGVADSVNVTGNTVNVVFNNFPGNTTRNLTLNVTVSSQGSGKSILNTARLTSNETSEKTASATIQISSNTLGGGGNSGGGGSGFRLTNSGIQSNANIQKIFEDVQGNIRNDFSQESCGLPKPETNIFSSCFELDSDRPIQFSDLEEGDSANPYILTLKNTRIIKTGDYIASGHGNHSTGKQQQKFSTGNWQFQPNRNLSRLEVVKMVLVANCIPVENQIPIPANGFEFKDLPTNSDPSNELENFTARVFYTAHKHGIVTGYGDGFARPYDVITDIEMLALALRGAKAIPDHYEAKGSWFEKYTIFAANNRILNINGNLFQTSTRKDFAKVLLKIMAFNPDPNIHGYIERVDIENQKYLADVDIYQPVPNVKDLNYTKGECEVVQTSCLEHVPGRGLHFADVNLKGSEGRFINILRTTRIRGTGDYIASGTSNHSTGKNSEKEKFQSGGWNYEPNRSATRLEVVKTALVANCIPIPIEIPIPEDGFEFEDLPLSISKENESEHFIARTMYTAYLNGIISPENRQARALELAKRFEALSIFSRAFGAVPGNYSEGNITFSDAQSNQWYSRDLSFAAENKIIENNSRFRGDFTIKRSTLARWITLFMPHSSREDVRGYGKGIIDYYEIAKKL